MQRKPRVPSALLAHLPTEEQDKLKRKHTEISALAPTTPDSTEAFLELRLRNLDSSLDYTRQYGNALNKSRKALGVNEEELKKELRKLDDTARELNLEAVTVKRQKRLILEDLKDTAPSRETMGKAYASVIMNKVMAASKTKFDKPRYLQTEFKKMICDYLHASKMDQGEEYVWCHVTAQWYLASETKTAHIVPKSLDGDEVAYLFGVGAISMSDERNGLTLQRGVEEGLDSGRIVFVPAVDGNKNRWKCVLVDQSVAKYHAMTGVRWGELHNKELVFLSDARPAARYLYFRYIITCLHHISQGREDWLPASKGVMWATPGKYLRESMLWTLAQQAGDNYAPEYFYRDNATFTNEEPMTRAAVPDEEEKDMAVELALKIQDVMRDTGDDEEDED